MLSYLNKTLKIFQLKEKKKFFFIVILAFFSAILEMIGVGLILPVIAILLKSEINTQIVILNIDINNLILFFEQMNPATPFILIIIIYLLKNLILFGFTSFNSLYINSLGSRLSTDIYKKYLNSDYKFHLDNNSSKLTFHCVEVVDRFKDTVANYYNILSEVLVIIFLSIMLLSIEPKGFLLSLIFILLSGYIIFFLVKSTSVKIGYKIRNLDTNRYLELSHGYGGIKEIKVFNKINYFIKNYLNLTKERFKTMHHLNILNQMPRFLIEVIFVTSLIIFLIYLNAVGKNLSEKLMILGIFGFSSIRMMPSFNRLLSALQKVKYGNVYIDTISEIFEEKNNIKVELFKKHKTTKDSKEIISFTNVDFFFSKKKILDNINLKIYNNEFLGIVGKTGSGKSTFLNLLLSLHKPTSGQIFNHCKKISFAPQSVYLLDETVLRNIAFGCDDKSIDINQANKCIIQSQLSNFIENLPQGLNTIVGEKGVKISGGELQRLAIARALYINPDLIIFDEATNSLDSITELKIIEIIEKLSKNITVIFVSHKLENLKNCSRIIKIENSKIIENL
jgi:ABC-type multidrug transport system fused ATPase/permease subunit